MRWRQPAGAILLALAVIAFAALLAPIGLHTDDLQIVAGAEQGGYADAFTATFLDRFYRPLTILLVKSSLDLFGHTALPLRLLQGALIAACVAALVLALRDRTGPVGRTAGGLCLLASPFTFIAVTPFAVGVADLIVGLAFLLAVRLCLPGGPLSARAVAALVGLSVVALLAKESGLLVAGYAVIEALRRRRLGTAATLLGLAAGYLLLRRALIDPPPFPFRTGFLSDMYSVAELEARFGESPLRLYLYNVGASLSSLLVYLPEQGQLKITASLALLCAAFAMTTAIAARAWRTHPTLLAVMAANALLGYSYVRPRIMFVAYVAMAILFAVAIDDLWRRGRRPVVIAALLVWLALLALALIRLRGQAAAAG